MRVAYVGPISFPQGGAAARRILGCSLSLREAGHEVIIGSGQLPREGQSDPFDFEGFTVYSLSERDSEHLPTLLKHLSYVKMGARTVKWLSSLPQKPDAVILYAGYAPYLARLVPWCRKRDIPLVFDAVEWYEPSHLPGGKFGPYRVSFELSMRWYLPNSCRVLAISRFLRDHYAGRRVRTVWCPPTLDTSAVEARFSSSSGKVKIAYAGDPGGKDLIDLIFEAMFSVDPQGESAEIHLAGLSLEKALKFPAFASRGLTQLPSWVHNHGSLPHNNAVDMVRQADFIPLFRQNLQYAKAGFSTKLVEALSVGTPPICNLTGDQELFLKDGENAILGAQPTVESAVACLKRAVELPPEDRTRMRLAARKSAEEWFDFRRYASALSEIVSP